MANNNINNNMNNINANEIQANNQNINTESDDKKSDFPFIKNIKKPIIQNNNNNNTRLEVIIYNCKKRNINQKLISYCFNIIYKVIIILIK